MQVFTRDGRFLRTIGSEGTGDGQLRSPRGVLVNGDELLVADCGNHRISVFERATGRWLRHLTGLPADVIPNSLALNAATATLFVSDVNNHCVHVLH